MQNVTIGAGDSRDVRAIGKLFDRAGLFMSFGGKICILNIIVWANSHRQCLKVFSRTIIVLLELMTMTIYWHQSEVRLPLTKTEWSEV